MDIGDIPLFSMLRGRLSYLSERQKLIAQNVANSDTPGFRPKDLKQFAYNAPARAPAGGLRPAGVQAVTQPGHMVSSSASSAASRGFQETKSEVIETTLDGNAVSLEEEMLKMSEARMSYDAAIGFYQKSMNLLRMAARPPGR
ncbi:flagellar basal body rod protein FlgB [Phenylobacterium sp. J367]|uniref:flagellar basal body rod protein FlgB n=1 Tax=Phenylobacterium sp. J367 TaxID=2898435 RepID=UPI0021513BA1|nr:flagellar basal body rod protein FlgB [Phenylobacterium sp. J367]MCR5879079.1 flagellar basal body rod protein FlgB [Phenylobacterium sp. J367]